MNTTTVDLPVDSRVAPNETTKMAQRTTTLSPRFYTTDVKSMNRLGIESVRPEWDALMNEFAEDNNRGHFVQDADWSEQLKDLDPELRKEFIDFLVSSLTAEFSGCVLYAELQKKGHNQDLQALFKYMARDESRHAGFINECLKDFDVAVDMSFLVKTKKYTHFSPKFILYATYLSEKIGYARYIKIFRKLERDPEHRFHPIFHKFERWCLDEFRHGEALAMVMRANPKLLSGTINRLWIRFFQLAVFATMFVRDHTRPHFHRALDLEPERYGMEVFRIVAEVSKQVFPVLVDIDNPAFLRGLKRLHSLAVAIEKAQQSGWWGRLRALPLRAAAAATFLRLYLLPTKSNELPAEMRVAAAW